jgi:hypothetical protein
MKNKRKQALKKPYCERCGATKQLTIDHIIPQLILTRMGFVPGDEGQNIQTLCLNCNLAKGNQLDPKNPRTIALLRYYFQRWVNLYGQPRVRRKYVFRELPVKSLTPDTVYMCESKKALISIYEKQRK